MTANNTTLKPPKGLGEAGKATWDLAWSVTWTHSPDRGTIEHLCRLEDQAALLCEALDRDGVTVTKPVVTPRGEVVGTEFYEHPALKSLRGLDRPALAPAIPAAPAPEGSGEPTAQARRLVCVAVVRSRSQRGSARWLLFHDAFAAGTREALLRRALSSFSRPGPSSTSTRSRARDAGS
jgi:hypothetical protein